MATSMISKDYVFETISFPAATISASGIGTFATNATASVAKSGYTPIGIMPLQVGHPAAYVVVLSLSGTTAYASFYRTSTNSYSVPNGDITATVIYKKA